MKASSRVITSLLIGVGITIIFAGHFFTITKDLSYFQIFGIESVNINKGTSEISNWDKLIGFQYEGKEILNPPYSGFPFGIYKDCRIRGIGMINFTPRCESYSSLSRLALVADTIFWGGITFGIMTLVARSKKKKKPEPEKK